MLGRRNAARRFLLEGMHHPDSLADLTRVDDPEGVARRIGASSITPDPSPGSGLAMSGIRPSATTVRARANFRRASSGKSAQSLCAPLIQLIDRVSQTVFMMANLTSKDK